MHFSFENVASQLFNLAGDSWGGDILYLHLFVWDGAESSTSPVIFCDSLNGDGYVSVNHYNTQ